MNDQIYDPHFSKKFTDRTPADFNRSFHLGIYAVGKDVETALNSLGLASGWCSIEHIKFQSVDTPCDWYVWFTAGGTSMKASGEFVTGGVIVTWWK